MMQRRFFLSLGKLFLAGWLLPSASTARAELSPALPVPPLMLAKVYRDGVVLADYWVSEKFDGVRGYWDGQLLWTRSGERIFTPGWFTRSWPTVTMDGELWAGHGQFAKAVSAARQQTPSEDAWRGMRFMVFDLPAMDAPFTERIPALNGVVSRIDQPWVQAVTQFKVAHPEALQALLSKIVANGGEGLMLHRAAAPYKGGRSDDLLKLKPHDDSEARVVAHIAGQGRHAGRLGALLVEIPAADGHPARRFKLGTGFSDAQRRAPPAVGMTVTYRFRGVNSSGIPRFASFLRVRED